MDAIQELLYRAAAASRVDAAAALVALADEAERSPWLQEYLRRAALPPPFHIFEYVKPANRHGYWARKPFWREHPTPAQVHARLRFSKINYLLYGTEGTVERQDGTRISRISHLAGELMRGKIVTDVEKEERRKLRSIERLLLL